LTLSNGTVNVQSGANVNNSGGTLSVASIQINSSVVSGVTTLNPTSAVLTVGAISNINHTHVLELGGTTLGNSVTGTIAPQTTSAGTFPINLLKSGTGSWELDGNNTFSAASPTGTVSVSGGTLLLAGQNTHGGGTFIGTNQGAGLVNAVLRATANNALGSGTVQFDAGGNATQSRLELANNIDLPNNAIELSGRNNNTVAIENLSDNNTLDGAITLQAGGTNYWIQSDAGSMLNLTGAAAGGTAITLAAAGTRTVTLLGSGSGSITGTLSDGNGSLALTMSGAGTWTIDAFNSYSGLTSVLNGELIVANPAAIEDGGSLYVGSVASFFAPVVPQEAAPVSPVPEPGTLALLAAGALTAAAALRRRKR
jgi:autotransporter-associated beta strand protein